MRASLGFRLGPLYVGTGNLLKKKRKYWHHAGCPIKHQRQDTAEACARRMAK